MDEKRNAKEQIAELLNEVDPVANDVAPGLSTRFKHLKNMAQVKLDLRETPRQGTSACYVSETSHDQPCFPNQTDEDKIRKISSDILTSRPLSGSTEQVFSVLIGGDRFQIRTPRGDIQKYGSSCAMVSNHGQQQTKGKSTAPSRLYHFRPSLIT